MQTANFDFDPTTRMVWVNGKFATFLFLPNNPRWWRPPSLISENVNNAGLDKGICTKCYGKMHHGHAEMIM